MNRRDSRQSIWGWTKSRLFCLLLTLFLHWGVDFAPPLRFLSGKNPFLKISTRGFRLISSWDLRKLSAEKNFWKIFQKGGPGGVKNFKIFKKNFFQKLFRIVWNEFWYKNRRFWNFHPGGQFWGQFLTQRINFSKIWNFDPKLHSVQIWSLLKQKCENSTNLKFGYTNPFILLTQPRVAIGHLWEPLKRTVGPLEVSNLVDCVSTCMKTYLQL